jgi:hypothetical protein
MLIRMTLLRLLKRSSAYYPCNEKGEKPMTPWLKIVVTLAAAAITVVAEEITKKD